MITTDNQLPSAISNQNKRNKFNIAFTIGNQDFNCQFAFNGNYGCYSTEAELTLSLLPAMTNGLAINLKGKEIDPIFLNSITDIQHIYQHWDNRYHIINILDAGKSITQEQLVQGSKRVATFFSGGVDSFYTLLKHREEITDIVFVHGLDIPLENTRLRKQTVEAIKKVAIAFNIRLLEVETDLKPQIVPYGEWGRFTHGIALASVALSLQNDISTIYIPSSHEYAHLFPLGTHPMLDHLWSTEKLRFIHDGAEATRLDKIRLVSKSDIALDHLRVCWKNPGGAYNCGICEKCLRTMISLYVFDKLDASATFEVPLDFKRVARMKLKGENKRRFAIESLTQLQKEQKAVELQKALKTALAISHFKGLFKKSYK